MALDNKSTKLFTKFNKLCTKEKKRKGKKEEGYIFHIWEAKADDEIKWVNSRIDHMWKEMFYERKNEKNTNQNSAISLEGICLDNDS